jgi:hypothetical protein
LIYVYSGDSIDRRFYSAIETGFLCVVVSSLDSGFDLAVHVHRFAAAQ